MKTKILSILADRFGLRGGLWGFVGDLDFGLIGIGIVAIFAVSWGLSTLIYRWKGYDDLPTTTTGRGVHATRA